jgi:DegV family protein with EDD domain
MSLKIITDSCADIPRDEAVRLGIDAVIPMRVSIGGEEYVDGVTISPPEFFKKLRASGEVPRTSQPSVEEMRETFEQAISDGGQAVVILVSRHLSGTVQAAHIARDMLEGRERLHIVDTETFTLSQASLVMRALQRRCEGKTAGEIAEELDLLKSKGRFYTVITDLQYLRVGGRLSGPGTAVGTLLNVKPTIVVREGRVVIANASLGLTKAYEWLIKTFDKCEIDYTMPYSISHAGATPDMLYRFRQIMDKGIDTQRFSQVLTYDVGVVTGAHSGPDCVGIAYYIK